MEFCDDDRHHRWVGTKTNRTPPTQETSQMAFHVNNPLSREVLQNLIGEARRQMLVSIAETTRSEILERARQGMRSYLWDMDDVRLATMARQHNWSGSPLRLSELAEALKAVYPDCAVEIGQGWVPVPQREGPSREVLQTNILIVWA